MNTKFKIIAGFVGLVVFGQFLRSASSFPTQTHINSAPTTRPTSYTSIDANEKPKNLFSVVKVIDGDTIDVSISGKIERIRLIGVDTPEIVDPRKTIQCFGKEASEKVHKLLDGKKVSLETDLSQGDKDKYSRLLRHVFTEDNINVAHELILSGFAHEYTYSTPYKYQKEFKEAQQFAEKNQLGLWAPNSCVTPTKESVYVPPTNTPTPQGFTQQAVEPTQPPIPAQPSVFSCSGKTKCGEMGSCEEARFYLTECGVSRLDGDDDGTPCETLCK